MPWLQPEFLYPDEDTLAKSESVGILFAVGLSILLTVIVSLFIIQFVNSDVFFAKILGVTVNSLEYGIIKLTFLTGNQIDELENVEFYLGGAMLKSIHSSSDDYEIGTSLYYQAPKNMRGTSQTVDVFGIFEGNVYQRLYTGSVSVTS